MFADKGKEQQIKIPIYQIKSTSLESEQVWNKTFHPMRKVTNVGVLIVFSVHLQQI